MQVKRSFKIANSHLKCSVFDARFESTGIKRLERNSPSFNEFKFSEK